MREIGNLTRNVAFRQGTMEHLTPSEIQRAMRTAKARSIRDWAMVLLAYRHGLRASEVCGLKTSDVDIRNESITLRRLKGSLKTVQPLYRHRGQPLLDEVHAMKAWWRASGRW